MRFLSTLVALCLLSAALDGQAPQSWDAQFRAIPDAANIREYMRRMSARPHHAGSPYGKDNAEWIAARLKEWGWTVEIEQFHALVPTPKLRALEMTSPTRVVAKLAEPAIAVDPTSSQQSEQLPSYNAYSADGDVTGRLVYVNYGRPQDYDVLDRLGISVKGADRHRAVRRIVARHQAEGGRRERRHRLPDLLRPERRRVRGGAGVPGWPDAESRRRAARQRHGHAGPSRRSAHARRRRHEGRDAAGGQGRADDHEDPGAADFVRRRAAAAGRDRRAGRATGVARRAADHLPHRTRRGDRAPAARVQLDDHAAVQRHRADARIDLPGRVDPARQPSRRLGERRRRPGERHGGGARRGARPRRAAEARLDAEADDRLPRLGRRGAGAAGIDRTRRGARATSCAAHAVVYINTDSNSRGVARHGRVARARRLHQRRRARRPGSGSRRQRLEARAGRPAAQRVARTSSRRRAAARTFASTRWGPAPTTRRFSSMPASPASHSASAARIRPASTTPSTTASITTRSSRTATSSTDARSRRLVGTAVIRLADAERLPFDFTSLADTVTTYVKDLQDLLRRTQEEARDRAKNLDEGIYAAMNDPRRPQRPPARDVIPPALNFAPLENAATALAASAARLQAAGRSAPLTAEIAKRVNAKLRQAERQLTDPAGLPGRPWFRHMLYAPGCTRATA